MQPAPQHTATQNHTKTEFRSGRAKKRGDLTEDERAPCKVTLSDTGDILDDDGNLLLDGEYIFVLLDNKYIKYIYACKSDRKIFRDAHQQKHPIHPSDLAGHDDLGSPRKATNAGC